VTARAFNHIGPGQSPRFAVADFARQISRIRRGLQAPVMEVGDIDVTRDFTDVRDLIAAYLALLTCGENGASYNVCSGNEISLRSIILHLAALTGTKPALSQDPARIRPSEQRRICGSHALLTAATGWKPTITLDTTLRDTLTYWDQETL
jgi:GDP-4-dehydro-6-deoxy-D-mannose reductase